MHDSGSVKYREIRGIVSSDHSENNFRISDENGIGERNVVQFLANFMFHFHSKDGNRDLRLWGGEGEFSHDLGGASEDVELILRMHVNACTVTL